MNLNILILLCFAILVRLQISSEEEQPQNFFDDWSVFNESAKIGKRGGIFVQVTQKGLDYIGSLTLQALKNFNKLRDQAINYNKTELAAQPEPKVALRFLKDTGIGAKIFLPRGTLKNLKVREDKDSAIQLLLKIEINPTGNPIIDVTYCESKIGDHRRGISSFAVDENICQNIFNLSKCWNLRNEASNSCWPFDFDSICSSKNESWLRNLSEFLEHEQHQKLIPSHYDKFLDHLPDFSVDFSLTENPTVDSEYILFPLRGEVIYQNQSSNITSIKPLVIDQRPGSKRMFRQIITEHFWNTFFHHLFQRQLITFEDKFSMSLLPLVVRFPLQSVCWGCHVKISLTLAHAPEMKIDSNGMKVRARFHIDLVASGVLYEAHVMNGEAKLNANLTVKVVNDQFLANFTIDTISVDPGTTGLASYMPITFRKSLEQWFEYRVWPSLRRGVHEAFGALDLTEVCGFNFTNTDLNYIDGATVLEADFGYDTEELIKRFDSNIKQDY